MENLILIIILLIIPLFSYIKIINLYNTTEEKNNKKLSGFEVARNILDNNDLKKMYIVEKKGNYTDMFSDKQKVVKLSTDVFNDDTLYSLIVSSYIASIAILDYDEEKKVKAKLLLDNIFKYITFFIFFITILGTCVQSPSILSTAASLLFITILYKAISILLIDKTIINDSISNLEKLEYFEPDDKEKIIKLYKNFRLFSMASIIFCIKDIISDIKEAIANSKR